MGKARKKHWWWWRWYAMAGNVPFVEVVAPTGHEARVIAAAMMGVRVEHALYGERRQEAKG